MTIEPMPEVWHQEKVEICGPEIDHQAASGGATIRLNDGRILFVYGGPVAPSGQSPGTCRGYARTSADECRTWSEKYEIIHHPECQAGAGPLLRDAEGTLWTFYLGFYASAWDKQTNEPIMEESRSDVWAARSFDEGQTWVDNQMIYHGYRGAVMDAKQSSSVHVVIPIEYLVPDPGRHVSTCVVSADGGESWELGEAIDIGQHGDHAGAIEPVVVELEDRRLWMLIRTNLGHFLQAFSHDNGLTCSQPTPT